MVGFPLRPRLRAGARGTGGLGRLRLKPLLVLGAEEILDARDERLQAIVALIWPAASEKHESLPLQGLGRGAILDPIFLELEEREDAGDHGDEGAHPRDDDFHAVDVELQDGDYRNEARQRELRDAELLKALLVPRALRTVPIDLIIDPVLQILIDVHRSPPRMFPTTPPRSP